eukprot:c24229_g1_i1 orf=483-2060(+)
MEDCSLTSLRHENAAEIDTTLPFRSVKAAVSMFAGADGKNVRFLERQTVKESELQQALEGLAKVREDLENAEKSKSRALYELVEAKKLLEETRNKFEEVDVSNESARDTSGAARVNSGELCASTHQEGEELVSLEFDLKITNETHMTAVDELEAAKQELERLKKELLESLSEKESAVLQAEEALAAVEINAKRVEELTAELSGTNESLVLVKLACIEANKERIALLAENELQGKNGQFTDLDSLKHDLGIVTELELKLAAKTDDLENLKTQLSAAKEAEGKATVVAAEALRSLDQANSELENTRMSKENAASSLVSLSVELEEAKANLKKAMDDKASLEIEMESIHNELESMKKEIVTLKEREANATAATSALTVKLMQTKAELTVALAAEAKAKEAISGLSQALQQVTAEVKEANLEADSMKEEANKVKADAEQAKAAMNSAEDQLQSVSKEVELAEVAESIALGRIKALSEKTNAVRASEVEAGGRIIISRDEYDSLKRKMQEVEELASMRVVAAIAQVEAVK